MADRDDIDMLAAEYVLGTLDEGERAAVTARRERDSDLDDAIFEWESKLSPLLAHVGEAAPREDLFEKIQQRIADGETPNQAIAGTVSDVMSLQKSRNRWRAATAAAAAIAASLLVFIFFGNLGIQPAEQSFVAVFQDDDKPPQFILSINLETRELKIRPVAAQPHAGKTYQLWIASDKLGPGPRSLGLLDTPGNPTRKILQQFDATLLRTATFGISLEPEGGSPTGKPTGPALHGTLIPTDL